MVITRSGESAGKSGDPEKPLTEAEIEQIQSKLVERDEVLKGESALLEEQRRNLDKRVREFEARQAEFNKYGAVPEEVYVIKEEMQREMDELRRENARLRNATDEPRRYSERPSEPHTSQGDTHSDTPQVPKVSFREATESVPQFDGYNIPLTQFIRACRRAKEVVPPSSERNLTKLLINKLRSRAYFAVEDEPCDRISQLIDLLTAAFGSCKTIDQYRGELSTIYLKPHEHILDYISRVKDLRSAILDAERRETGALADYKQRETDELTTKSFCEGLPLEYRLQMRSHLHSTPFDAFASAKIISKRLELDKRRHGTKERTEPDRRSDYPRRPNAYAIAPRPTYDNSPRERALSIAPQNAPVRAPSPRDQPGPPAFRNRDTRNNNFGTNATQGRREELPIKWCRYCKNSGHEIEECRKREYNNARKTEQGNATGPAGRSSPPRQGAPPQATRPVNIVEATDPENTESQH